MPPTNRRGPGKRLLLILAALASVVAGYYLGQYLQRRPLAELTAVVYPAGQRIDYPAELGIDNDPGIDTPWRLFLAADTDVPACSRLLRHYATVINRLAAWPDIQANLRLSLLAMDEPNEAAIAAFTIGGQAMRDSVLAAAG